MAQVGTSTDNLRTLLRMRPPVTDPYVRRRQTEIDSGYDDMVPDADSVDAHLAQTDTFAETGWAPSRDSIRSSGLQKLRTTLRLDDRKHGQVMEREKQRGDFDLKKEEVSAKSLADRLRYTQESIGGRQDANQAAIMDRLNKTIAAQGARQEDAQQHRTEHPTSSARQPLVPAQLYQQADKARSSYEGVMSSVGRKLGLDGGAANYEQSLTNILDRKGELEDAQAVLNGLTRYKGSLDERIAAAQSDDTFEFDLSQLDPYTRQYLSLKIGR